MFVLGSAMIALLSGLNDPRRLENEGGPWSRLATTGTYDHQDVGLTRLGHDGWYVQLGAGLVTTTDSDGPGEEIDFDEGWAIPVAIGRRFGANDPNAVAFDLELEALWTDQDANDTGAITAVTDVSVLGGLVNGVGDFAVSDTISLYAGGGIGLAGLNVGTSDPPNDFEEEDGPFLAWQLKAGVRLWASDRVAWSLGYRFLNIDDAEIDDDVGNADFDLETQQHILELGVRFGI